MSAAEIVKAIALNSAVETAKDDRAAVSKPLPAGEASRRVLNLSPGNLQDQSGRTFVSLDNLERQPNRHDRR